MRNGMTSKSMALWESRVVGPIDVGPGTWGFVLSHGDRDYEAQCKRVPDPIRQEQYFKECREDLAGFVGGFAEFGCGWPGHVFDGDVTDPALYLECVKCGAAKLINQVLNLAN